jgi:ribosomal protein S18 acetylase RimI-like enzyme
VTPELRWAAFGGHDYEALVELRREVLRRPLGMDFTAQQLIEERSQLHLGAWSGARVIGCLVLKNLGGGAVQMRQVAVSDDARKMGIGRLLVEESELEARRRGWRRMVLHARQTAVAFYERLGYAIEGEPFVEIGLPHRLMAKSL